MVAYQAAKAEFPIHTALEQIALRIEHSPAGRPLLLTLGLQNYMQEEHGQGNALLELLQQHLWSDRELIVHLDQPYDEAWRAIEIYKQLQRAGIPTMVDAAASWDLSSINILIDAHITLFNTTQLPEPAEQLLELAHTMGVQTLLIGIGNKAQAEWAVEQGFDWLQVNPANQISFELCAKLTNV